MDANSKPTFDFSSLDDGTHSHKVDSAVSYTPSNFVGAGAGAPTGMGQEPQDHGGYKGVHPIAAAFHVAFKLGALLTFILGGLFASSYVVRFVITILFCAADFWTTKNVTGRILVALRWWSEVKDDGATQWVFESSPDESSVNKFDSWFFWVTTSGYCVVWAILCLINILSLKWFPISLTGLVLAGVNLYAFFKCKRDAKARLTSLILSQAASKPEAVAQTTSYVAASSATHPQF